jgi:hypothetical protein
MARAQSFENSAVGHDSFLDVVTNMVGILIILVMVVGMRVKNAPAKATLDAQAMGVVQTIESNRATEAGLHRDMAETMRQIQSLTQEAAGRKRERDVLATAIAVIEHKVHERRAQLDATARLDFDRNRELAAAQQKLERLQQQTAAAEAVDSRPITLESYPTPIGKVVIGEEYHFQLRGGRIAFVPIEKLVLAARSDAIHKADKLFEQSALPEFTETVGPEAGFRFRYTVRRHDTTERTPQGHVRRYGMQVVKWTVIPVDSQLGEPVDKALVEGSQFRQILSSLRPDQATITVWVYEDSFGSFRDLRKELYKLGFPVAARPLMTGVMIAGSPKGTKSEAE